MGSSCVCEKLTTAEIVEKIYEALMQSVTAVISGNRDDQGANIIQNSFAIPSKTFIFNLQQRACIKESLLGFTLDSCTECDNKTPLNNELDYRSFIVMNHRGFAFQLNILNKPHISGLHAWVEGCTPPISRMKLPSSVPTDYPTQKRDDALAKHNTEQNIPDEQIDWDKEFGFDNFDDEEE